jgi:DNA transposition AAA+ family ATPase
MNKADDNIFVETLEYRRFAELCDLRRQCQYIGLCYGSPGVGKTLSTRRYSRSDKVEGVKTRDLSDAQLQELHNWTLCSTPRRSLIHRGKSNELSSNFVTVHRISFRNLFAVKKPAHSSKYRSVTPITRTRFSANTIGYT